MDNVNNFIDILNKNKFTKCINELTQSYDSLQNSNATLIEENKRLKSENYKDEELSKMKTELEKMREEYNLGFPISKKESEAISKWREQHIKEKHWYKIKNRPKYSGAISGRFTYEFIPTSIGVAGTIKCSCGEKFCFRELL